MNSRDVGFLVGGVNGGAVVMIAVAAWGSSLEGYRITCRPEGTKALAICSFVEEGRLWNLDSGEFRRAESTDPLWHRALGEKCAGEFRGYHSALQARMNGNDSNLQAVADGPNFVCYNRATN